jgi:hypothetical protein
VTLPKGSNSFGTMGSASSTVALVSYSGKIHLSKRTAK